MKREILKILLETWVKNSSSKIVNKADNLVHSTHMDAALNLARRGLGTVWPNPAVGCVIVKNNQVVGRGWTQHGGRPHAETEALRNAGQKRRALSYM